MDAEQARERGAGDRVKTALRSLNAGMIGFDLALGSVAIAAPRVGLRLLGHRKPSADAEWLFRRCGPIWLTFAAAHLTAAARGRSEDWWALAWLRGTELATDAIWAQSPAFADERSRVLLRLAGVGNAAMTAGFAALARDGQPAMARAAAPHGARGGPARAAAVEPGVGLSWLKWRLRRRSSMCTSAI